MSVAIRLDGVCKSYVPDTDGRLWTMKEAILSGGRRRRRPARLLALDDVTLDVARGRTVGLIGPNGAGKSTLLRLVAGLGRPDRGRIEVEGRPAALLELGAGFHPELTGRESVLVAGVIAGLARREVRARIPDIAAFAGLEDFLDAPIRTYSAGMQGRLAFSLAVATEPDVLLVDEVLAVGDIGFQARCVDRIRSLQRAGVTILLVSHDPTLVDQLCDDVVWLRGGRVVAHGPPREVTRIYREAMETDSRHRTPRDLSDAHTPAGRLLRAGDNRLGDQRATIHRVQVLDDWDAACERIESGRGVRLDVAARLGPKAPAAQLAVTLVRSDGLVCLDTSTVVTAADGGGPIRVRLVIDRLDLAGGDYAFDVGLYDPRWSVTHDLHRGAYPLRVEGWRPGPTGSVLFPPMSWIVGAARERSAVPAVPTSL